MKRVIIALSAAALVASAPAVYAMGVSSKTPGHQMQQTKKSTKSTVHKASQYSPGHKMQSAKKSTAPGASEYAPGKQTTTGSNTKR
jgi:hypothetical protein